MTIAEIPDLAEIWRWLDEVMDPEIPVLSVVDLGIVREIAWEKGAEDRHAGGPRLRIALTPTYSGCPATEAIAASIAETLSARGIAALHLETRLAPPWTTDWMSERGKERLKSYGIAPPAPSAATSACAACAVLPIACPRCGGTDTKTISRFGSTPCKAHHFCNACLEPFDHFKPH